MCTGYSLKTSAAVSHGYWDASRRVTQHERLATCTHQEITRVILCRLILNDIIIHKKFLKDINVFSKMVWHSDVTNFENYVV